MTTLPFETDSYLRLPETMRSEIEALYHAYEEAIDFTDMSIAAEDECYGKDFADATIAKNQYDCIRFYHEAISEIDKCDDNMLTQAGHDFWLTRNRHGSGFWDGDWPKRIGDELTRIAESFGEVDLYAGDDDLVYIAGFENFVPSLTCE